MTIKTISRPSIVRLAMDTADNAVGSYSLGAVITYGTSNKPIVTGCNSSNRTVYKFGSRRMIACSQHAEMSVASQLLNNLSRKGVQRKLRKKQKEQRQAKVAKVV